MQIYIFFTIEQSPFLYFCTRKKVCNPRIFAEVYIPFIFTSLYFTFVPFLFTVVCFSFITVNEYFGIV